jgi:4-hydroxy 2-oxovalerate aldolase
VKAPRLIDTTLRDGSHAMRHQFTRDHVRQLVRALDGAGVPVIEVSHGDGLAGSSVQYGISHTSEMELIEEACATATKAKIAVLLLPGVGTRAELKEAVSRGIHMVRVATQCTEADVSEQHFGMAKEMGLETAGFLMMAHMRPPEILAEQALLMESYGCDCVYVVDSAGALLPESSAARVKMLKQALTKAKVGFHAHNNLGLGIGNTLAALEAGADWVDGTLRGFGAGGGNAAIEVLAAVLDKLGYNPGVDVFRLLDAAEFVLAPIMPYQPIPNRDAIAIGYAGVYSTFLLHAKRLGEKYQVDPLAILVELGRRKTMAGQEDMILDVALDLSRKKSAKLCPA